MHYGRCALACGLRYGPNGPYYGFLNRIDGSFASFASWRIRFDSGSFIELTVITSPRMDAR